MKKNVLMLLSFFILSNVNALNIANHLSDITNRGFRIKENGVQVINAADGNSYIVCDVQNREAGQCGFAALGLMRRDVIEAAQHHQLQGTPAYNEVVDNPYDVTEAAAELVSAITQRPFFVINGREGNMVYQVGGYGEQGSPIYWYNGGGHWQRAFRIQDVLSAEELNNIFTRYILEQNRLGRAF